MEMEVTMEEVLVEEVVQVEEGALGLGWVWDSTSKEELV